MACSGLVALVEAPLGSPSFTFVGIDQTRLPSRSFGLVLGSLFQHLPWIDGFHTGHVELEILHAETDDASIVVDLDSKSLAFSILLLVVSGVAGRSFEEGSHIEHARLRRDHTATVIATGSGLDKHLLVNGYGVTVLTTVT